MAEEKPLKDKEQEFYFTIPNKEQDEVMIKCYKSKDVEEAVSKSNFNIELLIDDTRDYLIEKKLENVWKELRPFFQSYRKRNKEIFGK